MTKRDWIVAAVSAASVALVAIVIVALAWPDAPRRTATGEPTTPSATSDSSQSDPPGDLPTLEPGDGQETNGDKGNEEANENEENDDKDKKKPADAPPLADAPPAGEGPLPDASPVTCPTSTVDVSDADSLSKALKEAAPGAVIGLADGRYVGKFVATVSGSEQEPIFLCGGPGAVLDGDNIKGGYVLHLDHAKYWRLVGFTVTGGQKGVMADNTVGSVIQDLTVHDIGDEAIHLRNHSTENVVLRNTISKTGLRRDKFGEGVYIGSAVSNWCNVTDCQGDRSDRNVVKNNKMSEITSEAVDVKEGTTGGLVEGNTFDGSKLSGADSWVDIKGNNWLIKGNKGSSTTEDGFQTHQILKGWGDHNVFMGNEAVVNGPGHGFAFRPAESNVVTCDNKVVGAAEGLSNVDCR